MLKSKTLGITMILLIGAILIVPSTAAAIDNSGEVINSSEDNRFSPGEADQFNVTEGETKEGDIIWDVETEANNNKLVDDDSLHIYIDTGGETGLDSQTVQSSRWGNFFDGLDPINANYRVRISDIGPGSRTSVVEEHSSDINYEKISNVTVSKVNEGFRIKLDEEAIGSPDDFEYKFAYIAAPGEYNIDDSQFTWGPTVPQEFVNGEEPTERITIQATADFSGGQIDADSVEFRLESNPSGDNNTVERTSFNPDVADKISTNISLAPDDFGSNSELSVEVDGSERYPFERTEEINTSIGELDSDNQDDEFRINISRIKTEVVFADKIGENEVASGFFRLADADSGSAEDPDVGPEREFEHDGEGSLIRNFTVNPDDFDGGEIFIDVQTIGGEDYPFSKSTGLQFNSPAEITFNAGELDYGYSFELLGEGNFKGYNDDRPDVVRDDEFTMMVNLSKRNSNESIQQVTHTTEFDPDVLNVTEVTVNPAHPNTVFTGDPNFQGLDSIVDEEDGEIDINVFSNQTTSKDEPVANESVPFTYNVTFEIEDGLESGEDLDENVITPNFEITDVELFDANNETLSAIRADTSQELENSETRVTEAEITHLTEGGDMVGSPMIYEVDITTNNGKLGNVSLRDPDGKEIAEGNFDGKSGGVIELKTSNDVFDPEDNTSEADDYQKTGQFDIIIEDDLDDAPNHNNADVIYNATDDESLDEDVLKTTIYKEYDVDGSAQDDVTTEDVIAVAERVPEDGVDELPWGTGDEVSPRADLDNTGEVTSSNLATIVGEWNQADFVEEVNVTIDGETEPTIGVGNRSDLNVTVFDQRRGDTLFDADSSTEGGNVTVKNIDDGGDDVTVKNLSKSDTQLVKNGNVTFEDVEFNGDGGDTVDVTLAATNNIDDPDPEGTKETITVEVKEPSGSLDAELNTSSTGGSDLQTALNTSYTVKNAFALNASTINVSVSDGGNGSLNLSGANGNATEDLENGTIEIGDETETIGDGNVTTIEDPVEEIGINISEQDIEAGEKIILNTTSDVVQVDGGYNDSANITIGLKDETNDVIGTNATDQVSYNTTS